MSKPLRLFVEETPEEGVRVRARLAGPGARREDRGPGGRVAGRPPAALREGRAQGRRAVRPARLRHRGREPDHRATPGSAYGIPSIVAPEDREPGRCAGGEAARGDRRGVVGRVHTRTADKAPESLRKGPRGGGRDRSKIVEHVTGADGGYARSMGIKGDPETAEGLAAIRAAVLEVLARRPTAARSPTRSGRPGTPPGASRGTPSTTPGRSRTAPSATDARYDRAMEQEVAEALVRRAMAQASIAAARGDAPFGAVLATPDGRRAAGGGERPGDDRRSDRARRDRAHPRCGAGARPADARRARRREQRGVVLDVRLGPRQGARGDDRVRRPARGAHGPGDRSRGAGGAVAPPAAARRPGAGRRVRGADPRGAATRRLPRSRATGHKWVRRFRSEGVAGLIDRAVAATSLARATPPARWRPGSSPPGRVAVRDPIAWVRCSGLPPRPSRRVLHRSGMQPPPRRRPGDCRAVRYEACHPGALRPPGPQEAGPDPRRRRLPGASAAIADAHRRRGLGLRPLRGARR